MNDRLLTAGEVAAMLAVPVSWVRESTRSGAMPVVELGRYRRYDRVAALAWVESCSRPGIGWAVTADPEQLRKVADEEDVPDAVMDAVLWAGVESGCSSTPSPTRLRLSSGRASSTVRRPSSSRISHVSRS